MYYVLPADPLHERLWASCSHTCASVHQAVKINTGQRAVMLYHGWEGNRIGLASHWPTGSVVYPPTGSMALGREMSTPPELHLEHYDIFTFTYTYTVRLLPQAYGTTRH